MKQREAKRRKRIQYSQSIAGSSSSSNTNRIELNNEEIITAQSSFSFEKTQLLSIQRNEQGNELNALQKKRERQRRYREQNRDKSKQREAERRRRLQNAQMITELSTSPNIEFTEIINYPIIDEINTHSRSEAGLEEMQHLVVEVSQQNVRGQSSENTTEIQNNYSQFRYHKSAHEYFNDNFKNNEFGHACSICDRLWFEKDLKKPFASGNIINTITYGQNVDTLKICSTCKSALDKNSIPNLSIYNGFHYPKITQQLPKKDFITERLISPRIPFMQIRRLRHVQGQFGIYGQIINVAVDTMVRLLPRNVNVENCIYVHIKKKLIHKSSFVHGLINIGSIKKWLDYLIRTPLYQHYKITVNESFFNQETPLITQQNIDEFSENIDIEDSLTAQQQTLVWNEEKYLRLAPGQHNIPQSLLFDEHAEELSFPSIYMGHFRKFRDTVKATPFMMASSELRRKDRRGVDPYHLLYMAVKIMRLRVRDCLTIAFKHVGKNTNITKKQVQSEEYIHNCIESNLAFLRSIPNSVWY